MPTQSRFLIPRPAPKERKQPVVHDINRLNQSILKHEAQRPKGETLVHKTGNAPSLWTAIQIRIPTMLCRYVRNARSRASGGSSPVTCPGMATQEGGFYMCAKRPTPGETHPTDGRPRAARRRPLHLSPSRQSSGRFTSASGHLDKLLLHPNLHVYQRQRNQHPRSSRRGLSNPPRQRRCGLGYTWPSCAVAQCDLPATCLSFPPRLLAQSGGPDIKRPRWKRIQCL